MTISKILDSRTFYYTLFGVLFFPALLINLGVHHLFVHTDETRRALVALEMILSDNYVVPTLNGEFYYNKPPLYNWIIAASFKAFNSYSALALRFPMVVAALAFAATTFAFLREYLGNGKAALVAIATITSGRILFYDSFLGLIDIAFSLLIFVNFMVFFKYGKLRKFYLLYGLSYLLVAAAYLMKGLPPLVFQFFTVFAYAIYLKDYRFVFHKAHFVGFLFFLVPVGAYYFFYLQANPQSVTTLATTLWEESSKRTVTDHGIGDTLLNILLFPFENVYHFAPWSLLVVFLFKKGVLRDLLQDNFLRYAVLAFALNILVYWTSPGVHPRYLFMFLPIFYAVVLSALWHERNHKSEIIAQKVFGVLMCIIPLIPWVLIGFVNLDGINAPYTKAIAGTIGLLLVALLYHYPHSPKWIVLGICLLVIRVNFNWFVLPNRNPEGYELAKGAERVVEITGNHKLYILSPAFVHDGTSFMISRERNEILQIRSEPVADAFLIIFKDMELPKNYSPVFEFGTKSTDRRLLLLKPNSL